MCAVPWGNHDSYGGYLEYRGEDILSTVGMFSTVGDIMNTLGAYLEYRRGYHDYCGGVQYRGGILSFVICLPWGDIMSTEGVQYRGGTQITKDFPHGTEHPHGTENPPRCSRYPPHLS